MRITRLAATAAAVLAAASQAGAAELTLTVTDLRSEQGRVLVALVDSEAAWNEDAPPLARQAGKLQGAQAQFRFADLKPGHYAIRVMHDENENGELDTNFMGMPIEGYGFSNNPEGLRRAYFDEATFEFGAQDQSIQVRLR
jgi:uncharacterized protein (DUF2141 family)